MSRRDPTTEHGATVLELALAYGKACSRLTFVGEYKGMDEYSAAQADQEAAENALRTAIGDWEDGR